MPNHTPEGKFKSKVEKFLDKFPDIYYERRVGAGSFGYKKGLPDFFLVINGIHIELELKAKGGSPSPSQLKWYERFQKLNIPMYIIDSLDDLEHIIALYLC